MHRNGAVAASILVCMLVSVFGGFGSPRSAWGASGPDVRAVLQALAERMKDVKTIQTSFTETKRLRMFKHEIVLTGSAFMEKPDRFAWHTRAPMRSALVLKDDKATRWNEDTDRVEAFASDDLFLLKTVIDYARSWFYGSYLPMLDEYSIDVLNLQPLTLEFRPRPNTRPAALLRNVEVRFKADQSYIESIKFIERNGNQSLIEFTGTVINEALDESVWDVRRGQG